MNLFIAPHPDDECLFGAYTIMRDKPLVAVFNFQNRIDRNEESTAAMKMLGADIVFINFMWELGFGYEKVYVPALQGGHPWHDEVCRQAVSRYSEKVIYYSTYERQNIQPYGRFRVACDDEMRERKRLALLCYKSQIAETPIHFQLENKDEFYF